METISFARGVPAPECIPVDELADCARAAIEEGGAAVLSYGPGGGYAPLRAWIGDRYGVEPERVVVTNDGEPVAELRPLPRRPLTAATLQERFRRLPRLDPVRFRTDVDSVIDQAL